MNKKRRKETVQIKQNRTTGRENRKEEKTLIRWKLTEEKQAYSGDREMTVVLILLAGAVVAVMVKTYIFAALLVMATGLFIYINRQKVKRLTFKITETGVFLENDFLKKEDIRSFNIIDDPGERARLILKIEKVICINEIIPIYDINIGDIERVMEKLEIPKEETLEPNFLDRIATYT